MHSGVNPLFNGKECMGVGDSFRRPPSEEAGAVIQHRDVWDWGLQWWWREVGGFERQVVGKSKRAW